MPSARTMSPVQILSELLTHDLEAPSLLAEASHRQTLAAQSSVAAGQAFTAEQAARVHHEALRRRLDARNCRPMDFGSGLLLVAALGTLVAVLDAIELMTVLPARIAAQANIAAMAVWLTGAWLTAVAAREGRRALVAIIIAGAIALSLLLVALHGLPALTGWPAVWANVGVGVLSAVFITVLTAGAAVLIARMEPASVFVARRRWQQTHRAYEAACSLRRSDAEAAAVAMQSWLGLVRGCAIAVAGEDSQQIVHDTLTLAAALQQACQTSLDSSLH